MTYRNRTTALLAACLTATLFLASCRSSPDAGRPDSAPPSTTANSSITPSRPSATPSGPPVRPTTAEGLTLSAAEAFYRHYVDLMNYASQTGETAPLLAASESGCERCKEYASFVAKVNEANGGLTGDYRERVKEVSELVRGSSGRVGGSAIVTVGNYTTKATPTTKPIVSKAAEYTEQIALSPSGSNWVMYELKLESR
ncbi:DUF6318 family protein [Kribbella alba]|uniref:DUF6318 family protein n=1 Tax=Kribbella alba TaxID=190197 RepID=UPI0031E2C407